MFKIGSKVYSTSNTSYGLDIMTITELGSDGLVYCIHPKFPQTTFSKDKLVLVNSKAGKIRKKKIKELNKSHKLVTKLLNELFDLDEFF